MTENEISRVVLSATIKVHTALGPGLLESAYETALEFELQKRGLRVDRQQAIPLIYEGIHLGDGFRADMVIEGKVILEIKSLEVVPKVAYKVLLTYLRLADLRLGLMINFGEESLMDGYKRVVNRLE